MLLENLQKLQEIKKETSLWEDELTIEIDTKGFPYFILHPLSDMHIGAIGSDTDQLNSHLDFLNAFPAYTVLLGDLGDFFNPTKHAEGMMGDVLTPDDQLVVLRRFFIEYQDKILATVQDPSHTDWVRQTSGIEPQRWMVQNLQIPMLKAGGRLRLIVNGIEYNVLLFHKIARFNSLLNITNAGKRMLDMHEYADVVVSGHTHIGAFEKLVKRDSRPVVVNLGTFKTDDDYGERNGMIPRPQVFFPTLLFSAKKKNIEIIDDLDTAKDIILGMDNYFNKKYSNFLSKRKAMNGTTKTTTK